LTRSGGPGIDIIPSDQHLSTLHYRRGHRCTSPIRLSSPRVAGVTVSGRVQTPALLAHQLSRPSPPHVRELPQKHCRCAASKALSTAKAGDRPRQAFQGKQGRSILDAMGGCSATRGQTGLCSPCVNSDVRMGCFPARAPETITDRAQQQRRGLAGCGPRVLCKTGGSRGWQ
jgi:hypothetical protein